MNMSDIILKKKEGEALSSEEIRYVIKGFTSGEIPDYQMSALLMAICFQNMTAEETFTLTDEMKNSGDIIDLSQIDKVKVDKHSTGGVGDKLSLIAGPLAAACGVAVAKMSGRGLGFTGGTIDKLESIDGFQISMSREDFYKQVNEVGIALIGQTASVAPADKKIYALRDVTGTANNINLIASSIMSKKLAAGSDAILLDVKCGKGAFMEDEEHAKELAKLMCKIGKLANKNTIALITDMSQPLGKYIGNGLEVMEAIMTLKGCGPNDLTELGVTIAGYMIYLANEAKSIEEGVEKATNALENGQGLEKLRLMIQAQGGDSNVIDNYNLLPQWTVRQEIYAEKSGYVNEVNAKIIGIASQHTGAGRATKESEIDLSAGVILNAKVGDYVKKGDLLASFVGSCKDKVQQAAIEGKKAYSIGNEVQSPRLIKAIVQA